VIVVALPHHANVAAAVALARAGKLRRVDLHALTIDMLQTLKFASAVEVTGGKHALDLLRPRNRIIFGNAGDKK
jgi:hypothetical protein